MRKLMYKPKPSQGEGTPEYLGQLARGTVSNNSGKFI